MEIVLFLEAFHKSEALFLFFSLTLPYEQLEHSFKRQLMMVTLCTRVSIWESNQVGG
jgi:hypothetical protein